MYSKNISLRQAYSGSFCNELFAIRLSLSHKLRVKLGSNFVRVILCGRRYPHFALYIIGLAFDSSVKFVYEQTFTLSR